MQPEEVSEGGQEREPNSSEPQFGTRIDRLSEVARTILGELQRIKSEGASEVEDDAEGARVVGAHVPTARAHARLAIGVGGFHAPAPAAAQPATPVSVAPVAAPVAPGSLSSSSSKNLVWLNVGGTKYCSTLTTLTKSPHSMLGAMFSGRFTLTTDEKQRYFIDRDGKHFGTILNFLRDGSIVLPSSPEARAELLVEAQYYQLSALIELLTPEERVQASHWRWSPGSKSAYITLVRGASVNAESHCLLLVQVNDFRTARAGEGKNWNSVLGDTGYSSGRHYFEITIAKYNNSGGGWGISFGLVDVLHDFEYNHFGHRDNMPKGTRRTWAYVAATGKIYERGVEMFAGRPYSVNDRVGLLLDWKVAIMCWALCLFASL